MKEEFYIGQIFEKEYPPESAIWCNEQQTCHIEEIEPQKVTRRFQIVANPEPTEEEIKQRRIDELQSYLTSTDWYAIRFADTGEPIPDDIKQQRQEARAEISRLRGDLENSNEPITDAIEQEEISNIRENSNEPTADENTDSVQEKHDAING